MDARTSGGLGTKQVGRSTSLQGRRSVFDARHCYAGTVSACMQGTTSLRTSSSDRVRAHPDAASIWIPLRHMLKARLVGLGYGHVWISGSDAASCRTRSANANIETTCWELMLNRRP